MGWEGWCYCWDCVTAGHGPFSNSGPFSDSPVSESEEGGLGSLEAALDLGYLAAGDFLSDLNGSASIEMEKPRAETSEFDSLDKLET